MASKDDNKDTKKTRAGVRKRTKAEQANAEDKKDKDVVRAPKAPGTAPTKPQGGTTAGGRRVVDPKKAEAEAKRKAKKEREAAKKARRAKSPKKSSKKSSNTSGGDDSPGFQFGDADATMDDFAAMLDGEAGNMPQHRRFDVGDTVTGEVVSIGRRYIFVDIGTPDEAMAVRGQFVDEEGNLELEVGDQKEFYVIGFDDGVELGRELGGGDNKMEAIETAYASGVPISGRVMSTNKGGFEVKVAGVDAFCPISQIELGYTDNPEIHVGQTYTFEVSEIDDSGRTVVVSRAALLERERASKREETLQSIEVGDHVDGVITRVADFGAFVDIGGVEGLVHVSELSHTYFDNPSDVVKVGDHLTVEVLNIEEDEDGQLRIGLSAKNAQDDPWEEVNEHFTVGETVRGDIVRLAPFGAFVELMPGVEGLVHVSEISRTKHVSTPHEFVSVGESVQVEVQDIDILRKRISLSMAATEDDPWKTIDERFQVGMEVQGVVENVQDFGAFIDLGQGITALLPRSEMRLPSEVDPHRKFSRGQEVSARVLNIEADRQRMALTLRDAAEIDPSAATSSESKEPSGPSSYEDSGSGGKNTLGTLGDLLQSKLDGDD